MPRYMLTVAYDGTHFHGWQKQQPPEDEPLRTAQGVLEETVRHVVREEVQLLGASRTDAGVHARGQVAAFTSETDIPTDRIQYALNSRLPDDLQVRAVRRVVDDFDPISHALAKGYRFRIAHGRKLGRHKPLFDRHITFWTAYDLNQAAMNEAAAHLIGEHDFAGFTRLNHGRENTIRTIEACTVTAVSGHRCHIDVAGNGFLYNMVRIIAGTLVEVGRGRIAADKMPEILASLDRRQAGQTLPPEGLCLRWIRYPFSIEHTPTDGIHHRDTENTEEELI